MHTHKYIYICTHTNTCIKRYSVCAKKTNKKKPISATSFSGP